MMLSDVNAKCYVINGDKIATLMTEELILLVRAQGVFGVFLDDESFLTVEAELRRRADAVLSTVARESVRGDG